MRVCVWWNECILMSVSALGSYEMGAMNNLLLLLYWVFFLSLFLSFIWLNRLSLTDWNGTNYNGGETTRVVLGAVAALGRGRALSHSGSSGCVLHARAGRLGGGRAEVEIIDFFLTCGLTWKQSRLLCLVSRPRFRWGLSVKLIDRLVAMAPNKGTVVFLPADLQVFITWLSISTAFWAILELKASDSALGLGCNVTDPHLTPTSACM